MIIELNLGNAAKEHMVKLYRMYGTCLSFAEADIMQPIELTASPAGKLIRKLKDVVFIERTESEGRGKYRFK